MPARMKKSNSGVTLMEVTLAVALFAVVIAMSAQALISFYAAIDVQEQRVEAMQAARAVLAHVRQKRADFEEEDDVYNWSGLLSWFNTKEEAGWTEFLRNTSGTNYLPDHDIDVTVLNMDGDAANAGDNPLEVHVTSSWSDLRGRTISVEVVGVLSEK